MAKSDPSDHDLLIGLAKDMCWLKQMMTNHFRHHWAITVVCVGALLTGIGSFVCWLLSRV